MARTRSVARKGPPPKKPAQKLPRWLVPVCYVAIPLCIVAFVAGCFGIAVIVDEPDRVKWYSNTQFGDLWRALIQKNPFYLTIFVNGGMVMSLLLATKLYEHRQAVKAEEQLRTRAAAGKEQ